MKFQLEEELTKFHEPCKETGTCSHLDEAAEIQNLLMVSPYYSEMVLRAGDAFSDGPFQFVAEINYIATTMYLLGKMHGKAEAEIESLERMAK